MEVGDDCVPFGTCPGQQSQFRYVRPGFIRSIDVNAGLCQPFKLESAEFSCVHKAKPAVLPAARSCRIQENAEFVFLA